MRKAIVAILLTSAAAACSGSESSNQQANGSVETSTPAEISPRPASFAMCVTCHSDVAGRNLIGPTLHGVVGRGAGSVAGFAYSPAMKASGIVWDEAEIDRFLENPRALIPGTMMSYPGLKDPQKRAEITAYLATLK